MNLGNYAHCTMAKALFGLLFTCFFLEAMTSPFKEEGGEYHPGFVTPEMGNYNDDDCREPCSLDVAVLIDVSKSMDKTERGKLKNFFNSIVEELRVSPDGTHMAIITFGSDANLIFTFSDNKYHNAVALKEKAGEEISFEPAKEGTRTDLAEELAVKEVFTPEGGDRDNFRNVMIILTDGKYWKHPKDTKPEVDFNVTTKTLETKGVKVIVAGIGSEIKSEGDTDENLEKVAGKKGEIIKYANFGELSSKLNDFKKKVCVVDGRYTDWSESECSATCGGGTLTQTRTCTNPPPSNCGKACIGPAVQTIACNEEECPRCPMDLVFVLDSSDTVGEALKGAKDLVKGMVKGLKLGPDDSQVALVLFADEVRVEAPFSKNYGVKEFQDIVQSLQSIGSRTRIDKALLKTKEEFEEGRYGAYKIAVVLTDGKQSQDHDSKSLLSSSEPLRNSGVRVIAVGIGAEATKNKLRLITDSMEDVKMKDEALTYFQELTNNLNQNRCVPPTPKAPAPEVCEDNAKECAAHKSPTYCNTDHAGVNCPKTCELCFRLGLTGKKK